MAQEAAIQLLLKTLLNFTKEEIQLIFGVDEERDNLFSNFRAIQAVLKDAEMNPPDNEADQDWLIKLQDAVFEMEDILDECNTHFSKAHHLPTSCCFTKVTFWHKIGMRMKATARRLDVIAKEHANYQRIYSSESQPIDIDTAAREMGSLLNETEPVIGREDEKEMIVDILVNQVKDNRQISILPIIGVGGLGKTTFAQLLFNDPRVVEHFEKKMWACVSDNFDVKTLIKAVIKSENQEVSGDETLDALQLLLCKLLIQKRYLLVLDDVWSDDMDKWSRLKNALSCCAPGSSIIVTTRLRNVAEIMGTLPVHELKGLTEEQCWMLLKRRACLSDEEEKYPNLENIGKQIAKKCAGVPLAAKVLGGLMRFQRSEKEWMYVKESEVWHLREGKKILSVLRLSYQHLPLYLRQCFAYCAIFPKNSNIYKEDLIHRWAAHGYISSDGTLEVEDVGERIWNELIMRSLFQNVIQIHGEILTTEVTMQDLVHDLAQSIMESKVPTTQLGMMLESESDRKVREVNLSDGFIAFPKSTQTQMDISSVLKKYNRLRVLDASWRKYDEKGMRIKELPSIVGSLQHLRSLNLSNSEIRSLPDSICDLWNLQLLNLNNCKKLERLCKKMRNLKNLRHLLLEGCSCLCETPSHIRELTFLRTLSRFIIGHNKGNGLEELEHLNIGGSLEIHCLDRVKNHMDAKKANLSEKQNLRRLHLYWFGYSSKYGMDEKVLAVLDMDEKVLAVLEPHSHVKYLQIYGFSGRHFPAWMKMSTLVEVEIWHCKHIVNLSPLEEMPLLESLSLRDLDGVVYIGHGGKETSVYFPALRELQLHWLPNLKRLLGEKVGRGMCPQLQQLNVDQCPLLELSSITFTEEFQWNDNPPTLNDLLKHPTNLKSLEIGGVDVQCLPEAIGQHPSLERLQLRELCNLTSLPHWLGDLTSLEILTILNCPKLASLPDSIQRMKNLNIVQIVDCPELKSRCSNKGGADWHKIAHIPSFSVW